MSPRWKPYKLKSLEQQLLTSTSQYHKMSRTGKKKELRVEKKTTLITHRIIIIIIDGKIILKIAFSYTQTYKEDWCVSIESL